MSSQVRQELSQASHDPSAVSKKPLKKNKTKITPIRLGENKREAKHEEDSCHHCIAPCLFHRLSNCLLWAIGPAPALVEKKFIGAFGTADAVITGVHTGLTAGRAVLTQLSGRVRIWARWTLLYAGTVLVQEISCEAQIHTHPHSHDWHQELTSRWR